MDIYTTKDFIDKYVAKLKASKIEPMIMDTVLKLNRILQKENLHIDDEGYLILKSVEKESETRICNFFVIPTHVLLFYDGVNVHESGLCLTIFSKLNNDKYKINLLNLHDEAIEKGNWLNTDYIDRDLMVYSKELYRYLRITIKLSSRILKRKEMKLFCDEGWLEDEDVLDYIEYKKIFSFNKASYNDVNEKKNVDAVKVVNLIKEYTGLFKLTPFNKKPTDLIPHFGWEDEIYFYLPYAYTWKWLKEELNKRGYVLEAKDKHVDELLIEKGVYESNEQRANGVKRADRTTTVYPGKKERVFMVNKERMITFLKEAEVN